MQTPVHPRPGAPGTGSRRRALAGGLALLAAVATLALPMAPAAAAPEAGQYVQVAPTTVVNNVSVPAGGITSLRVTGANGIPAPAEVSAVAVNVVANQPSGAGWLQAYPEGDRPVDSTLNFSQGRTTANFEVVPIPADGRISIFSTTATKVIVRLRGWYSVAPAPEGGDWAQEGNGPAHLGTNDAEPVLTPSTVGGLGQAWAAVASTPVRSDPVVVGQVVYTAAFNGTVSALDAATGATIWTAAVGSNHRASPAVVDGVVYVGSSDGRVYALSAATGASVWTAATGGISTDPTVAGGTVYVGANDGRVHALNAATGARIWTATTGGPVREALAVAGGLVYARSYDGNLYALDAATGAGRWTADIGGRPNGPGLPPTLAAPLAADGRVYVAGPFDAQLYALDPATGASIWTADSSFGWGEPALAGGTLYAAMHLGVGSCDLRALDAATGATVWNIPGSPISCVASDPSVANGVLYHGASGGILVARNAATGAFLYSDSQTPGRPSSGITSVVIANGAVYAAREASLGQPGITAHHP
jgi:outer membrane protein assembly factor BamB